MYELKRQMWIKTTERYHGMDFPGHGYVYRLELETLAVVKDMADALAKFPRCRANGYSPILEAISEIH